MKNRTEQNRTEQNHYCLLTNNLNFYISQFFKAFNFLSVRFRFAKNQFAILNNNLAHAVCLWQAHCVNNSEKDTQVVKTTLLYNFLTLIKFNFDSLSRKIKSPCLVINKNLFLN